MPQTDAFRKFICHACGYIYDEALGDADGGLAPGTRYEDIPDDWMCPVCGVNKLDFSLYAPEASRDATTAQPPLAQTAAQIAAPMAAYGQVRRGGAEPVVIVGGGIAAWSVARALRARDASVPIMMLSGCSADEYHKPLLSVACAQGKAARHMVSASGVETAQQLGIRLLPETWISGIDPARRRVRSTRGSFGYRHLVLATGAVPAPLPLDAESLRCIWRINHLDQYAAFRQRLESMGDAVGDTVGNAVKSAPRNVIIIGAGLIGCELADDLAAAGHRCTLLEASSQALPGLASPEIAAALVAAMAQSQIRFRANARVVSVRRGGTGYLVQCADGVIDAGIVLAATGLRTDARLARWAGLAFDNGYAVDAASMRTSDPHIFAAGDCASFNGRAYRFIEPIHRQADVIAARITGAPSAGFEVRTIPVRLKSRSMPLTLRLAA